VIHGPNVEKDREAPSALARRKYEAPRLVTYGHVKDVVQGSGGSGNDGGANHSKVCWIAEALWGIEAPRTLLLRSWLADVYEARRGGWRLIALYRACGRRAASMIRRGLLPRSAFRNIFNYLVEKAALDSLTRARH